MPESKNNKEYSGVISVDDNAKKIKLTLDKPFIHSYFGKDYKIRYVRPDYDKIRHLLPSGKKEMRTRISESKLMKLADQYLEPRRTNIDLRAAKTHNDESELPMATLKEDPLSDSQSLDALIKEVESQQDTK
tara:strand:- start:4736 stop:5131 length:396 start_codon:yes stop_codon:yes gene_type:complete